MVNFLSSSKKKKVHTGGPRIARKFVPKILRAIQDLAILIYNSVRAENRAIANNRTTLVFLFAV